MICVQTDRVTFVKGSAQYYCTYRGDVYTKLEFLAPKLQEAPTSLVFDSIVGSTLS